MKREKDNASDIASNGLPTPTIHPMPSAGSSVPTPSSFVVSAPPLAFQTLRINPNLPYDLAAGAVFLPLDYLLTADRATRAPLAPQAARLGGPDALPDSRSGPVPPTTPDGFLTPHSSTTLTYVPSEARLEASGDSDEKDLSGEMAEEPCCDCCGCIIN